MILFIIFSLSCSKFHISNLKKGFSDDLTLFKETTEAVGDLTEKFGLDKPIKNIVSIINLPLTLATKSLYKAFDLDKDGNPVKEFVNLIIDQKDDEAFKILEDPKRIIDVNKPFKLDKKNKLSDDIEVEELSIFHLAIIKNMSLKFIEKLIERGGLLDNRDSFGNTPIILAVKYNRLSLIETLIDKSNEVNREIINMEDKNNLTALHSAIIPRIDHGFLKLLIEKGAATDIKVANGLSALQFASLVGNYSAVKTILENIQGDDLIKKEILRKETKQGQTALHYAAISGNFEIYRYLSEKSNNLININNTTIKVLPLPEDKVGATPLHYISLENLLKIDVKKYKNTVGDIVREDRIFLNKEGRLQILEYIFHQSQQNHQILEELLRQNQISHQKIKKIENLQNEQTSIELDDLNNRITMEIEGQIQENQQILEVLQLGNSQRLEGLQIQNQQILEELQTQNLQSQQILEELLRQNQINQQILLDLQIQKGFLSLFSKAINDITPIHCASYFGKCQILESMLETLYSETNNLENLTRAVKHLFTKKIKYNSLGLEEELCPLDLAYLNNQREMVFFIIDNLSKDFHKRSPNWRYLYRLLIGYQISDEVPRIKPENILSFAKLRNDKEIICLIKYSSINTSFGIIEQEDMEVAANILENENSNIVIYASTQNDQHKNDFNELLQAIRESNLKKLNILTISKSFLLELANEEGKTPLHIAVEENKFELLVELYEIIEKNGHIVRPDKEGKLPIHYAVEQYKISCLKKLIHKPEFQVYVFHPEKRLNLTFIAIEKGGIEALEIILNENSNYRDIKGNNILGIAIYTENKKSFEYIIKNFPSKIHESNHKGETSLHLAMKEKSPGFVLPLISLGADINKSDCEGATPVLVMLNNEASKKWDELAMKEIFSNKSLTVKLKVTKKYAEIREKKGLFSDKMRIRKTTTYYYLNIIKKAIQNECELAVKWFSSNKNIFEGEDTISKINKMKSKILKSSSSKFQDEIRKANLMSNNSLLKLAVQSDNYRIIYDFTVNYISYISSLEDPLASKQKLMDEITKLIKKNLNKNIGDMKKNSIKALLDLYYELKSSELYEIEFKEKELNNLAEHIMYCLNTEKPNLQIIEEILKKSFSNYKGNQTIIKIIIAINNNDQAQASSLSSGYLNHLGPGVASFQELRKYVEYYSNKYDGSTTLDALARVREILNI